MDVIHDRPLRMDSREKEAETKVSATLPTQRGYRSHVIRLFEFPSPALRNDGEPVNNLRLAHGPTLIQRITPSAISRIRLKDFETGMRQ